jgi:hypothetical protein
VPPRLDDERADAERADAVLDEPAAAVQERAAGQRHAPLGEVAREAPHRHQKASSVRTASATRAADGLE